MELLSSVKYNIKDPELYCVVLWLWNCVAGICAGLPFYIESCKIECFSTVRITKVDYSAGSDYYTGIIQKSLLKCDEHTLEMHKHV